MNKLLVYAILAALLIVSVSATEQICPGADFVEQVDMWVVGDDCHHSDKTTDSAIVDVPKTAVYYVTGVVNRGNPDQCQTNEAFYLENDGQLGSIVQDDSDPCAIFHGEEYVGTFSLSTGQEVFNMNTASKCPPDVHANSVDVETLCFYEEGDGEVPEFGMIGAAIVVATIAGIVIFKRKN